MAKAKMTAAVKELKKAMATEKKIDSNTLYEYDLAFTVSKTRGHCWTGAEIREKYSRFGDASGATKTCHVKNEYGVNFKYIVVKRFKRGGWIGNALFGSEFNQVTDEIDFWERYADDDFVGDSLCPVLRWHKERSDKAKHTSEKGLDQCLIVAQKAVYIGDLDSACVVAEELNDDYGFIGESSSMRKDYLIAVADKMKWHDCTSNPGNSGVIFDFNKGCYKAVFVDYAL